MKRVLMLLAILLALPILAGAAEKSPQRAYAFAPRTGKVSLRKTASKSAAVLKTIHGGEIVEVLDADYSGFFSKVRYQGTEGFVTKALTIINYKPIATATLNPGGATIYQKPQAEGVPVAQWPAGKQVSVYPWENWFYAGAWYEVEADGLHGFAAASDLTLKPDDHYCFSDQGPYTVSVRGNWTDEGKMNLDLLARLKELDDTDRLNAILYYQVYANNVRLEPALWPMEPHPFAEALYTGQVILPAGTAVLGLCPVYTAGPRASEALVLRLDAPVP